MIIILKDLFVLCDPPILIFSAEAKEVNKILIPEMNFAKISTALLDCLHGLVCLGYFPSLSDHILPRK